MKLDLAKKSLGMRQTGCLQKCISVNAAHVPSIAQSAASGGGVDIHRHHEPIKKNYVEASKRKHSSRKIKFASNAPQRREMHTEGRTFYN